MRCLPGARGRQAAPVVHDRGRGGGGQRGDGHRGPLGGRDPPGAARLGRAGRGAVRVLPVRPDHVRRGPDRREAAAERCRHRCGAGPADLPLRHLPACPGGRASRRRTQPGAAQMSILADPNRREFLKTAALSAAGLVIAFYVPAGRRFAHAAGTAAPAVPPLPPANAFLRIAPDDTVTVLLAHSEMGQGIWTSLPMLIAEELDADWSRVRVEHAPAAPVYAHTAFGAQLTGGSTTTWSEFDRYRQVGAMARDMLVRAAAERWKVDPRQLRAEKGHVWKGKEK